MEKKFKIRPGIEPKGDQKKAISSLVKGLLNGNEKQILRGVTGSGKTVTMAFVIQKLQRPTLVLSHNKTLAAQLYREFRELFPENAVEFFISYYDYYRPEAYIPETDTFIEKSAEINAKIEQMRHSATTALLQRRDVIVVSSISCIYGLGPVEYYENMAITLQRGQQLERRKLLRKLVEIQYQRSDYQLEPGTFRVRGERLEIFPPNSKGEGLRVDFWDDEIEELALFDTLTGKKIETVEKFKLYPSVHTLIPPETIEKVVPQIRKELEQQLREFESVGRLVEAQRLRERVLRDIDSLESFGYCPGIENYSRYLSGRKPGEPPICLLDYFPDDFITFIDESHVTVPQIKAMYRGDRSRKETLVRYGFRLPSALDNRPLKFEEFWEKVGPVIFVSATPGEFEYRHATNIAEQIIRPTGLLDPEIKIWPAKNQVEHLLNEIKERISRKERVLVTTLTKKLAEKLTTYYREKGLPVRYLHSGIDSLERIKLLQELREGKFYVLIGVNLLREGLDLPEVSLVAILDADQRGFLRSATSLIQTAGRAARNAAGTVFLYADEITPAIRECVQLSERQRQLQMEYNKKHGIKPQSIRKKVVTLQELWPFLSEDKGDEPAQKARELAKKLKGRTERELREEIAALELEMLEAAKELKFERAAELRDQISALRQYLELFN